MRSTTDHRVSRTGVTLLELIVAIAIVGLLLAISLPALRSMRAAAEHAQSLTNVRTHALRFETHAAERGEYPLAKHGAVTGSTLGAGRYEPPSEYVVVWLNGSPSGIAGIGFSYFTNDTHWPYYLVSIGDAPKPDIYRSPSLPRDASSESATEAVDLSADYFYSHAFMAGPEHFVDPLEQDSSMWRAIRPHEVAHPSAKAVLFERSEGVRARYPGTHASIARTPMAFADGHASARRVADARPAMPSTPGRIPNEPILNTFRGVLGRDF